VCDVIEACTIPAVCMNSRIERKQTPSGMNIFHEDVGLNIWQDLLEGLFVRGERFNNDTYSN